MTEPMNGKSSEAPTAHPTRISSFRRRRASKNVHATSASQTTTRTRTRRLTVRLSASLSIPNSAIGMAVAPNWVIVAEPEEDEDDDRDHGGHKPHHRE